MRRLTAALAFALLATGLLVAPAAGGAGDPKIVIIVGAVHGQTSDYLKRGNAAYDEAIKYSSNVVKVFSPCATWSKVKAAVKDAKVVIYMGHGNGYPSPYRTSPWPYSQNGFGLNATCNDGHNNTQYYGEYYMKQLDIASNAVVLLHHLCYASGNSEPGYGEPTLTVARQRIDNYGAGFLAAGASVVIAEGHSGPAYLLSALFSTSQTMDSLWRAAPNFHNHVRTYASTRTPGATYQMDPDNSTSGFYRSIVGDLAFSTDMLTRVAVLDPQQADPFADQPTAPDPAAPDPGAPASSPEAPTADDTVDGPLEPLASPDPTVEPAPAEESAAP